MEDKKVDIKDKQINYLNKTVSRSKPDKITDIDVNRQFEDSIVSLYSDNSLDLNKLNSFTSISSSRDQVYNLIDYMAEDSRIAAALNIYTADVCETNEQGHSVWVEADDPRVVGAVNSILDSFNVDKNTYNWVYSLIKYGDLYLRLYRRSEFDNALAVVDNNEKSDISTYQSKDSQRLTESKVNEDVILKLFSKNDQYAQYMEAIKNPAEMFDLVKYGKSYGYIKTNINNTKLNTDDLSQLNANTYNFNFDTSDVDIFPATEFVHACLNGNNSRVQEEVTISNKNNAENNKENEVTFNVKRGQSVLYNSFKDWRELSLLENSVMLNRITKSSILRTVQVEVGDMSKKDVELTLRRIKNQFEQKTSISIGNSLKEYTNPGPVDNIVYISTRKGSGAITSSQIGGDVNVGDLTDLSYWKNKLYTSIGIPKQFLGETDDNTGFNGGTSLSLISSNYAKEVKRIQNAYIQAITDAVNLVLVDRNLLDYIGKFDIKMQVPTTQEELDRRENQRNYIGTIRDIMDLLSDVDSKPTRLKIIKSLLSNAVSDGEVIQAIQDEIDNIEQGTTLDNPSDEDLDLGGGDFSGGNFGGDFGDIGSEESSVPEDMPMLDDSGEELPSMEDIGISAEEAPEESFYSDNGGELLNEANDLPSWNDLGISFNNVK